jgi:Kef-type K+ transport system membrane component KefB
VLGKVAAGYSLPWRKDIHKLAVGVGMVPRGEVGLIFAQIGLLGGVLTQDVFSAVLIMVMATTLITPPFLKVFFERVEDEGTGGLAAETAGSPSRAHPGKGGR